MGGQKWEQKQHPCSLAMGTLLHTAAHMCAYKVAHVLGWGFNREAQEGGGVKCPLLRVIAGQEWEKGNRRSCTLAVGTFLHSASLEARSGRHAAASVTCTTCSLNSCLLAPTSSPLLP